MAACKSASRADKMLVKLNNASLCLATSLSAVFDQTFQRLDTCPDFGCVLPPDKRDGKMLERGLTSECPPPQEPLGARPWGYS
jgi:hypothetical protein